MGAYGIIINGMALMSPPAATAAVHTALKQNKKSIYQGKGKCVFTHLSKISIA